MIKLMKLRDKKEQEIDTAISVVGIHDSRLETSRLQVEHLKERYQKWKEEKNIEGLKY